MDKDRINFNQAFEDKAHLRALSVLVGALVQTHPDKEKLVAFAEGVLKAEEAAFAEIARRDSTVNKGDTHFIANQFAVSVRERMAAIMTGHSR
uniref:hypothetical protein n=1 Tax=Xanthomonas sp. 0924 TaxID=2835534 RepID=UPI003F7CFA39